MDMLSLPSGQAFEFLDPVDALIAALLKDFWGEAFAALEIGVYLGGWSQVVLLNAADSSVVGVDPYPEPEGLIPQQRCLQELTRRGLIDRFTLVSEVEQVDRHSTFQVVHIDGMHDEEHALKDLVFAESHLSENGLVIVDDYRHPWFPGVSSALYQFLSRNTFQMIAATPDKAYLARCQSASQLRTRMEATLKPFKKIEVVDDVGNGKFDSLYSRSTSVMGSTVLLIRKRPVSRIRHYLERLGLMSTSLATRR